MSAPAPDFFSRFAGLTPAQSRAELERAFGEALKTIPTPQPPVQPEQRA